MNSYFLYLAILLGTEVLSVAQEISSNPFGEESTSNPYSETGSPFGANSINNPFSQAGSPFGAKSPNNPFGHGPEIDTTNPMDKELGLDDEALGLKTKSDPLKIYAESTRKISQETDKMLMKRLKEGEHETDLLANSLEEAILRLKN